MHKIKPARRDWDYVTFEDYAADTKQLADQAAGIAAKLRQERDDAIALVHYLVWAAGEIEIPCDLYRHLSDQLPIEKISMPDRNSVLFRADKRKSA